MYGGTNIVIITKLSYGTTSFPSYYLLSQFIAFILFGSCWSADEVMLLYNISSISDHPCILPTHVRSYYLIIAYLSHQFTKQTYRHTYQHALHRVRSYLDRPQAKIWLFLFQHDHKLCFSVLRSSATCSYLWMCVVKWWYNGVIHRYQLSLLSSGASTQPGSWNFSEERLHC